MNKNSNDSDETYRELASILHSYVLANWNDPAENLKVLKAYIKSTKKIDFEEEKLLSYVNRMKFRLKHPKIMSKMKSNLFTRRKKERKYRFGSDFCGSCNMYKNYAKECPHCGYHEITY